ncbi:TetR/AcrR family transcriptional regulator [Pseudonocardia sp. TRM90224]|uniref:TetR/AcrR family transcriptional regulator n=1 Tax=Pseudonocardia sp. TRM90224 TaxID=2812678 RepID=UPI0027E14C77|nr:TetR/AcrR family transcriptional regulator [Pseudonocardia sp. TRM90224]
MPDARTQVLDAAEDLFYGRGIQSVGVDEVRAAAGVSLKRLYQLFPGKDALVREFLHRRDERWRRRLAEFVAQRDSSEEQVLAVFDWLHTWFSEPGYRGCAFINSFGELGAVSPSVVSEVRAHKVALRDYLGGLVAAAGRGPELADHLLLLVEGAIVTSAVLGDPAAATQARTVAAALLVRPE